MSGSISSSQGVAPQWAMALALATGSASGATLDLYDASLRRLATGIALSNAAS